MRNSITVILLLVLMPLAAMAGKKPTGRIPDVAAFNSVRSYCIDTSELSGAEAHDLKAFINVESKPKDLLTKLPWKLKADCTKESPDAVAKVSFSLFSKAAEMSSTPPDGRLPPGISYVIRAYLQVFDGESQKFIYELESQPLDNPDPQPSILPDEEPLPVRRRNATYRVFWTMIDDLQHTSRRSKNSE